MGPPLKRTREKERKGRRGQERTRIESRGEAGGREI